MPLYVLDLFSGCGGLSQGFKNAGWQHILAVEKLSAPSRSYAANFHCPVWSNTIGEFLVALRKGRLAIPQVDAVNRSGKP